MRNDVVRPEPRRWIEEPGPQLTITFGEGRHHALDVHEALGGRGLADSPDPREDPTCSGPHLLPADPALNFPSGTFRVLKNKEEKAFGECRTRRLVLEAWERQGHLSAAGR